MPFINQNFCFRMFGKTSRCVLNCRPLHPDHTTELASVMAAPPNASMQYSDIGAGAGSDKSGRPVDLSRRDLRGADLSGRNLTRAKLVGANLSDAVLAKAELTEADLFGANLTNADLRGADLSRATLRGVSLHGANLSHANLTDADFRGGVMLDASGTSSIGRRVTDIADCICDYASATRAKMAGVDLRGASFVGANLDGANLFGADLSDGNLSFARLQGAHPSEAPLGPPTFAHARRARARLLHSLSPGPSLARPTTLGTHLT